MLANGRTRPPNAPDSYLAAIYLLEEEGVPATQIALVRRLGHTAAAVSEMTARLQANGLVIADKRHLELSATGRARAETTVRRHRLAERLLTDVIGITWTAAHDQATMWEQVISDEVEDLLVSLLGNPTTSSLGTPIPGTRHEQEDDPRLSDGRAGQRLEVTRMTETLQADHQLIDYLAGHGVAPGVYVTVENRAPDGTLTLASASSVLAVPPSVACQIHTRPAGDG